MAPAACPKHFLRSENLGAFLGWRQVRGQVRTRRAGKEGTSLLNSAPVTPFSSQFVVGEARLAQLGKHSPDSGLPPNFITRNQTKENQLAHLLPLAMPS
jgi:hypothetical protein